MAILEEYWEKIGGRDKVFEESEKAVTTKKRGRAPGGGAAGASKRRKNVDHPADSESPASLQAVAFKPPAGSWEDGVDVVDMYRDENGALMVYLTWKSGDKTQHAARQAYQRCPQKVRAPGRVPFANPDMLSLVHRSCNFTRAKSISRPTEGFGRARALAWWRGGHIVASCRDLTSANGLFVFLENGWQRRSRVE